MLKTDIYGRGCMARQKWEYKQITCEREWELNKITQVAEADPWIYWDLSDHDHRKQIDHFASYLSTLGEDGWELVSIVPNSSYLGAYHHEYLETTFTHDFAGFTSNMIYYFKRPKE